MALRILRANSTNMNMNSVSSTLPMIQTPRISPSLDRPPVILQDAPQVKEKTGVVKNTEGTLPALAAAGNKISKDKLPDKLPDRLDCSPSQQALTGSPTGLLLPRWNK